MAGMKLKTLILGLTLTGVLGARADFEPIALTPGTFNYDIIVENTAPGPLNRATRATMDGGTNNSGATFYETGYNTNAGATATGIPAAGSTFTHANLPDHQYAMAASYTAPNALLINPGQVTNGTLTLTTPAILGSLSFLASGGNGGVVVNYTIRYADTTTQAGTITIGDWFNGANFAWNANGRVSATAHTFDNVNNNNPRIYGYDVALANTTSEVTSVDISYASGGGRAGIFALSGAPAGGGNWSPIAITGYNYDMIVEVSAPQAGALRTATTASMDGGTNNTGNTWFERGYDVVNTNAGLPRAGTTITSAALPDHHYMMAENYSANNAVMVDTNAPLANLTPAVPAAYSALSFLSATANGTVSNLCIMQYEDGSSETNAFLSRDWFNNAPVAFTANGRVSLNSKTFNNINAGNPRLYEAQFALGNTASPVTNIVLIWAGGSVNSRAVILAVSGTAGAVAPIFNLHPQAMGAFEGSNVTFSAVTVGSEPITYRWQKGTNGVFVDLENGANVSGATTTNLVLSGVTTADAVEYRMVASNSGGTVASLPARLAVLSTLPDVTAPGDVITTFGGTAPDGEGAAEAIANTTQKFLNFGGNAGTPPFVGPVGVVITPALGQTRVNGIRIYTANDGTERDPTGYILEGSTDDGANYTLISSNALSLPEGRNGGGTTPISPTTQFLQQVLFANTGVYTTYRVTFTGVKNATAANSLQIAELELLGVFVPPAPKLTIVRETDGMVTVTSSMAGFLETTGELRGEDTVWEPWDFIQAGPTGAQTLDPSDAPRYFRVVVP